MPTLLHDPAVRDATRARIQSLTPSSVRRWGKMTADQMLWHCSQSLENALGDWEAADFKFPLPLFVVKFAVFNLPWPRGAPTAKEFEAGARYDFSAEQQRLLALVDRFTSHRLDATHWGRSAAFGTLTGSEWSRLQAKHLDHHLRQFSA